MLKNKVVKGKELFLFMFSIVFLFFSTTVYAAEFKDIWNHISISDTDINSIDSKIKDIWTKFEISSVQRGMLIKHNYQPFVPIVNRIIILDTPAGEIAYRNYSLRVETKVIDGKDANITALTLSRISETEFPEATLKRQFGYVNGRLGASIISWAAEKKIATEELSAFEQLKKLENFRRSIELEFKGDIDYRGVPLEDVFYFFPEISNDFKLNFSHLYPQNETPILKTTYEPGRIRFGSLLDSDVKISFYHNIITGKMVYGDICWKTTFTEFTTGEEIGLCESFFYFIQETLSKANLIAPAVVKFY